MTKKPSENQQQLDDDTRCPTDPESAAAWRRKHGLKPSHAVAEAVPTRSLWCEAIKSETP
jgi:hypothetical protein